MSHYFRLFDIEKYRRIQPIVEKMETRNATVTEATLLLDEAFSIAESDEFNKYNSMGEYGNSPLRVLKCIQDLIQKGKLSELIDIETDDMLQTIIFVICCPRYQVSSSIHVKEISDTYADYTGISGHMYSFNEEFRDILDVYEDSIYPLEIIPSDTRMGVFNKEQLAKIQLIVSKNIATLSHKKYDYLKKIFKESGGRLGGNPSNMADVRSHINLWNFHREFDNVLKLANSQSYYTIINEYNF
jgi:hypothetical protein